MASANRIVVMLKSTESSYVYYTQVNTRNQSNQKEKLALMKYDPILKKKVLFKQAKLKK